MSAPRLRAAFVGADAARLLAVLAPRGPVLECARWSFHAVQPRPIAGGEWARGVDVLVLGAPGSAPRQALLHAAVAGVPRILLVANADERELALRTMCSDLGLDGDDALVVRDDADAVREAMDGTAKAPPSSAVMSGLVVSLRNEGDAWRAELRGTVLRGSFATGTRAHVHAGAAWLACDIGRLARATERSRPRGVQLIDVARAGDQVALGLRVHGDAIALTPPTATGAVLEVLVADEPLPLVDEVPLANALEPVVPHITDVTQPTVRAFLGWSTAPAFVHGDALLLERTQPAPPTGRYLVLPR